MLYLTACPHLLPLSPYFPAGPRVMHVANMMVEVGPWGEGGHLCVHMVMHDCVCHVSYCACHVSYCACHVIMLCVRCVMLLL